MAGRVRGAPQRVTTRVTSRARVSPHTLIECLYAVADPQRNAARVRAHRCSAPGQQTTSPEQVPCEVRLVASHIPLTGGPPLWPGQVMPARRRRSGPGSGPGRPGPVQFRPGPAKAALARRGRACQAAQARALALAGVAPARSSSGLARPGPLWPGQVMPARCLILSEMTGLYRMAPSLKSR
jgi:hypothetical protein